MEWNKLKTDYMRLHTLYILCIAFFLGGCDKDDHFLDNEISNEAKENNIPEGYFVVNFSSQVNAGKTKSTSEKDDRISHLRYIVYKSTGEFVKERILLAPEDETPTWPMAMVNDTLPVGEYTAIFLGNVEKTLFPYTNSNSETEYSEVFINYQDNINDARIVLPNACFTPTTEYYWARTTFSDQNPYPTIILQRIISSLKVQRNFVDAQDALNMLLANVVAQMGYRDIIRNLLQELLPGFLTDTIRSIPLIGLLLELIVGGLDAVINALLSVLLEPLVDLLYQQLLKELINQLGITLVGNTNEEGLLGFLTDILNPWIEERASCAVVTVNNFPRSIDFDLNVCDTFQDGTMLKIELDDEAGNSGRHFVLKGFDSPYIISEIKIAREGILSGIIINGIIDDFLLSGAFININDPLHLEIGHTDLNRRYQVNYSLLNLRIEDAGVSNNSCMLNVKLGDIANIDNIISSIPLLGPLVSAILSPVKNIEIKLNLDLPLLELGNINAEGGLGPILNY